MTVLTKEDLKKLDTPQSFTDIFRQQVGDLLDLDLSDVKDLPVCGTIGKEKNIFAVSLLTPLPSDIYCADAYKISPNKDFIFADWLFRFGFTPRALNAYAANYDRIHKEGAFPKQQFIKAVRRAKNCAYKQKSRKKISTARFCPSPT